jgi:hypothetical protein
MGQRVGPSGGSLWTPLGVLVSTRETSQGGFQAVADGSSGAIIVWADQATSDYYALDVFGQRLGSDGSMTWNPLGMPLSTANLMQTDVAAVTDGRGGVIAAWTDYRNALCQSCGLDIYGSRLAANGAPGMVSVSLPGALGDASLGPPYPNPAFGPVTARFVLRRDADIDLTIQDLAGRLVGRVAGGRWGAGSHSVRWDGRGLGGQRLSSGVYWLRLSNGEATFSQKLVVAR